MNCVELRSELALRAFDLGREGQAAAWSEHLSQCSQCERELGLLGSLADWPGPAPEDPNKEDELWDVISARIDVEGDELVQESRRPEKPILIGLSCSYCHDSLDRSEASFCGSCLAPHHSDCFRLHGRCTTLGCDEVRTVQALGQERPVVKSKARLLPWFAMAFVVSGTAAFGVSKLFLLGSDSGLGAHLVTIPVEESTEKASPSPKYVADIDALNAKLEKYRTAEEREQQRSKDEAERQALVSAGDHLKEAKRVFQSLSAAGYENAIALLELIPESSQYYEEAQAWRDFGLVELALNKSQDDFNEANENEAIRRLEALLNSQRMTETTAKRVKQRIQKYRKLSSDFLLLKLSLQKNDLQRARTILKQLQVNTRNLPNNQYLCRELLRSISPEGTRRLPKLYPDIVTGWTWTPKSFELRWRNNPKNQFLRMKSTGVVNAKDRGVAPMTFFFPSLDQSSDENVVNLTLDPKRKSNKLWVKSTARFQELLEPYFPEATQKEFVTRRPIEMATMLVKKTPIGAVTIEDRFESKSGKVMVLEVVGARLEPSAVDCRPPFIELQFKDSIGSVSVIEEVQIFRRSENEENFELIKTLSNPEDNAFRDRKVKAGAVYHYRIRTKSKPDEEHPAIRRFKRIDRSQELTWDVEFGPVKMLPSAN